MWHRSIEKTAEQKKKGEFALIPDKPEIATAVASEDLYDNLFPEITVTATQNVHVDQQNKK